MVYRQQHGNTEMNAETTRKHGNKSGNTWKNQHSPAYNLFGFAGFIYVIDHAIEFPDHESA